MIVGTYPVLEANQRDLRRRNKSWRELEGGVEKPTFIETLKKPEQQRRIRWLVKHCRPATDILEIGCSWGYVLDAVNGKCGVDINSAAISVAQKTFPWRSFLVGDATRQLPFEDGQYAIVLLSEILEHIEWRKVKQVVFDALRISRSKVLITLPQRPTADCALCFKHRWLVTPEKVSTIWSWVLPLGYIMMVGSDKDFLYIELWKNSETWF